MLAALSEEANLLGSEIRNRHRTIRKTNRARDSAEDVRRIPLHHPDAEEGLSPDLPPFPFSPSETRRHDDLHPGAVLNLYGGSVRFPTSRHKAEGGEGQEDAFSLFRIPVFVLQLMVM